MFSQSRKLQDVVYEIRGPVHDHAMRLEADGHRILKLNIGNPAPFGFGPPRRRRPLRRHPGVSTA